VRSLETCYDNTLAAVWVTSTAAHAWNSTNDLCVTLAAVSLVYLGSIVLRLLVFSSNYCMCMMMLLHAYMHGGRTH